MYLLICLIPPTILDLLPHHLIEGIYVNNLFTIGSFSVNSTVHLLLVLRSKHFSISLSLVFVSLIVDVTRTYTFQTVKTLYEFPWVGGSRGGH